jgi:hypothetical protein
MFVRALAGASTATECGVAPSCFDHIVMNLPASAVEFLGAPSGGSPLDKIILTRNEHSPLALRRCTRRRLLCGHVAKSCTTAGALLRLSSRL